MKKVIRRSDAQLASVLVPISQKVPAALITSDPTYLKAVALVPDWFFWASVGFAAASIIWDPFQRDSRIKQFWHWLFDRFEVERLIANEPLSAKGNLISAELHIRFRRPTRGHLWLRLFSCTGLQREPGETVYDLGTVDQPKGGQMRVELARLEIPYAGWTPPGLAGLIADGHRTLAGRSQNLFDVELTGVWPKQTYRCFVARLDYSGGETRPSLFVVGEEEDIFDGERNVRR